MGDDGQKEPRFLLAPDCPRQSRWGVQRKSRLIESFILNAPVPPVIFDERDFDRFEALDGRWRLAAIGEFYEDKFALTGLELWLGP
ncbi:MAG: hypothetical protein LBS60_15505 [Deltaproteobacteria bacterium]|nr:hypothetical protein [Deltaproteobacteria bacterium]